MKHNSFILRVESMILWAFLFLLPTQLGKHFFIPQSYISGVRIDYLAITIYLTDILVGILAILHIRLLIRRVKTKSFVLFLLFLAIQLLIPASPWITLYRFGKLLELWIIFVLFQQSHIRARSILSAFLAGAVFQIVLVILQLIGKQSVQGIFYFFGERAMNLSTPDIAKFTWQGIEFLRPYGTFSHPNSLGGFFLLLFVFISFTPAFDRFMMQKQGLLALLFFLIIFSFSKAAIFAFFFVQAVYALYWYRKTKCIVCIFPKLLLLLPFLIIAFIGGHDPVGIQKRLFLVVSSIHIILTHPVVGVGLGNYLYAQASIPSPFAPYFLQPVHNIFLLLLSETGIVGFLVFFNICIQWLMSEKITKTLILMIVAIALTGLFDHYWLTLQQNLLIMGVVFGLATNQFLNRSVKRIVK